MDSTCVDGEGTFTLSVCVSRGTVVTVPVSVWGPPLALSRGEVIGWISQNPV